MIKIQNVTKIFSNKLHAKVKAVDNVSLEISAGEIFGVIGYSGAGRWKRSPKVQAQEPCRS